MPRGRMVFGGVQEYISVKLGDAVPPGLVEGGANTESMIEKGA